MTNSEFPLAEALVMTYVIALTLVALGGLVFRPTSEPKIKRN